MQWRWKDITNHSNLLYKCNAPAEENSQTTSFFPLLAAFYLQLPPSLSPAVNFTYKHTHTFSLSLSVITYANPSVHVTATGHNSSRNILVYPTCFVSFTCFFPTLIYPFIVCDI